MKVLIIVPNASANSDLDWGKESREIESGLYSSTQREQYSISTICSARPQDIRRKILRDKPEYIHICGHSVKDEGVIIQDDDADNIQFLNGVILKEFFGLFSDKIQCILLNSCYSSEIAKSISEEINYVIGMKNRIQDGDAIEFAVAFYDGIFSGESIENSFKLASNSLKWSSTTQYPEPILYKKQSIYQDVKSLNISDKKNVLIAPSRLPSGNVFFCGRENELKFLDECWNNNNINVVCIEAWGGVGKTALVAKWRSEIVSIGGSGAEIVFDWSFHSQGNISNRPVSADLFFDEAFRWFRYKNENEDEIIERGEKLALLVRKKKAIVILDGIEALQYSDNFVGKEGVIKDYSLRVFVSMLADYNPGLCVITTRKTVSNLNFDYGETIKLLKLSHFNLKQSMLLLKKFNVYGSDKAINEICHIFMGHALSLNLVATYIRDNLKGNADDFTYRNLLGDGNNEELKVRRIMKSYEEWYGNGQQIQILRILSLFDRPAKQDEIKYLLKEPIIRELTDKINYLETNKIGTLIRQLKRASLIIEYEIDSTNYLDTHPIIREYFSKKLLERFPVSFKEGHYKLYKYFSGCGKECAETVTQMNFWFRAVYHGCLAEKYEEVFECIYLPYMKQNEMIYDARLLGGNSTDLDAIGGFFTVPWKELKGNLNAKKRANIYAEASFALRSNGLIVEAIEPLDKAYDIENKELNYEEAAMDAGNLSELHLVIGDLDNAFRYIEAGISLAEKSNKVWRHYWVQLAKKADILSKSGRFDFAVSYFRQAESVQKYFDKESERLYGVLAFKKFDAYLTNIEDIVLVPFRLNDNKIFSDKERDSLIERLNAYTGQIHKALQHDLQYKRILHIALDNLILVRIMMLQLILQFEKSYIELEHLLTESIKNLYESGRAEYIPYGLLTRVKYWYLQKNDLKMSEDIVKTEDFIKNKKFKLFEIDVLIEKVYLHLLMCDKRDLRDMLNSVKKQCEDIGYLRKIKEINILIEKVVEEDV